MGRRGFLFVVTVLVLGSVCMLALKSQPAEASFSDSKASELVTYLKGDAAYNLKLMALEALRKKSGTESDLGKFAAGSDKKLAIAATTSLGKMKTSNAKTELKKVFESTKRNTNVRQAAMTSIAVHWKSSSDLTYLEKEAASDSALKAHAAWLKTYVYEK